MTPLDALHRAYEAWRLTEPQLFMTDEVLWPDSGLDEQEPCALLLVEPVPAASPYPPSGGGLAPRPIRPTARTADCRSADPGSIPGWAAGAEPCRDLLGTDGKSSLFTAPAPAWAGSAPPTNQTAADRAYPPKSAHGRRQEGSF